MGVWGRVRALWNSAGARQAWRGQKGPLHSDVFRKLNTLQLHAPLDKRERDRLQALRSSHHRTGRREDELATRVRHLLNAVIGVAVGFVAVGVRLTYQAISGVRFQVIFQLLGEDSSWVFATQAALAASACTAVLGLAAAALVAWQPAAASSGIPGVIAYLNGVDLNHALGSRVLVAKILGTILAVSSGLAVGPEGPMIHIGAMVGRLAVYGLIRPVLRCMGTPAEYLNEELEQKPLRYEVQAAAMGAGAGIAAAFRAPLAGTLFVVEEAASFFSKRLFLHTFITCASALFTTMVLDWLTNAESHSFYARTPQCSSTQSWSALLLLQVALLGMLCSLLGWAFNRCVVAISRASARQAYALGRGWKLLRRRFAVVAVLGAVSGAFSVVFVASRPCADASLQRVFDSSSGCIPEEWMYQIALGTRSVSGSQVDFGFRSKPEGPNVLAYVPAPGLFGAQFDPVLCPEALNRSAGLCRIPGIGAHIDQTRGVREEHYCCGFASLDELERGAIFSFSRPAAPLNMMKEHWPRGACKSGHFDKENSVWIGHYSPAAALAFTNPATAVRNLLVRGAPGILPAGDLLIYLAGYGMLTMLSTGASVPGGLLVPMMVIGAATGRLSGLLWDWCLSGVAADRRRPPVPWIPELRPLMELVYPNAKEPLPGLPPEPGVLALAGCAAFLSGSGALSLFVIVLLVEITLEPFLIPVVIIAVLAARGTASLLHSKGLYHDLMEVQSLPFLSEHHHWRQAHYVVTDVLTQDVAVWQRQQSPWDGSEQMDDWTLTELSAPTLPAAAVGSPRPPAARSDGDELARARELLVTVDAEATREDVRSLLEGNPMVNGFPVVGEEDHLLGLATRASLERLLRDGRGGGAQGARASGAGEPLAAAQAAEAGQAPGQVAGVEWVMDCAPFVVPASTHLKHAHMLFYQCGLRHVVVVDSRYRPVGLLTRKSLMPWRVPPVPSADTHHDTFVDSRNAHSPIHSPPSSPSFPRRSISLSAR